MAARMPLGLYFLFERKKRKQSSHHMKKYGWQARVWIPPQEAAHGNSTGIQIQIFVPKGSAFD